MSPSKNKFVESGVKYVYSTSSFNLDKLIYESKQMSFYNYDYNKKLYAEIELFLKLSLYGDSDSLLRKLSFNCSELQKICNIDKLTKHMNIDPKTEVEDTHKDNDHEMRISLKRHTTLFDNITNNEHKVISTFLFKSI